MRKVSGALEETIVSSSSVMKQRLELKKALTSVTVNCEKIILYLLPKGQVAPLTQFLKNDVKVFEVGKAKYRSNQIFLTSF